MVFLDNETMASRRFVLLPTATTSPLASSYPMFFRNYRGTVWVSVGEDRLLKYLLLSFPNIGNALALHIYTFVQPYHLIFRDGYWSTFQPLGVDAFEADKGIGHSCTIVCHERQVVDDMLGACFLAGWPFGRGQEAFQHWLAGINEVYVAWQLLLVNWHRSVSRILLDGLWVSESYFIAYEQ